MLKTSLEFFKDKKILVIVPHEDDEICFTGGLLASIENKNTRIIYTTNGNYIYPTKRRYKEAIKSCKKFGINRENIVFLGYSDSPYDEKEHMYTTEGIWKDKYGNDTTNGVGNIKEYCFDKKSVHNNFTKENLISDIKDNIIEYKPDIILCIDLDFHPDHIMTSLCTEKAVGEILKTDSQYRPIVLKGFAYENAYFAPCDYNNKEIKESNYNIDEKDNLISNPYYSITDGLNIKLKREAYTRNLLKNKVYKSILCHKSQALVCKSFAIINPNIILWKRDTNNLINNAKIMVTSGNKEFLNDFLLCDSSNILNGNRKSIIYNKGIWIPEKEDREKKITIDFNDATYIERMKIYNGIINKDYISKLLIKINENDEKIVENEKNILDFEVKEDVKRISITILDDKCLNGFSEIELLKKENNFEKKYEDDENYKDYMYSIRINNIINLINVFCTKVYRKLFIKKMK